MGKKLWFEKIKILCKSDTLFGILVTSVTVPYLSITETENFFKYFKSFLTSALNNHINAKQKYSRLLITPRKT